MQIKQKSVQKKSGFSPLFYRKIKVTIIKTGIKIGIEYFIKYPKKLGMVIPDSSAMDLTIKLGAFPIYVFAPIKTAPIEIAVK